MLKNYFLIAVRDVRRKWGFHREERPEVILHALERTIRSHED